MKHYRIAVCLSGELRTWEFCKESIKKFFEQGTVVNFPNETSAANATIEVDYFTHTWDSDRKYYHNGTLYTWRNRDNTTETNDNAIQTMVDWLKPKKHLTGKKRERTELNEIGTFLDLFQSFAASVKLKREYEIENNFEYDIVVKCRYDLLFSSAYEPVRNMIYPWRIFENTIYNDCDIWFTNESNRLNIQDVVFYGSSFSMDRLSNVYAWQMSRRLHTPHKFGRPPEHNKFNVPSLIRSDVVQGVWLDPGPTTGGPGVTMNDFMHKTFLGNRPLVSPWHWECGNLGHYTIVRPFTTCFDYSTREGREMMRLTGSKIHNSFFKNPKAVIFDLDGVLVETGILHKESLIEAVKNIIGMNVANLISEKSMLSTRQKIRNITRLFKLDDSVAANISAEKDRLFFDKIENLKVKDNVIQVLIELRKRNIRTAIASNSRLININKILDITGLRQYFDVIVSSEEVKRPKPMPDILFEVYKRLRIHGHDCTCTIFVEDSDEGARAGEQSPSAVVRVENPDDLTFDKFQTWID